MPTHLRYPVLIVIVTVLLSACYASSAPLSQQETAQLIADQRMTPIIVKQTTEATLILFRRDDRVGCSYASQDHRSKGIHLMTSGEPFYRRNIADDPLVVLTTKDSTTEYYCVLINTPSLQQQTHFITIVFGDGQSIRFEKDNAQGAILVRRTSKPQTTFSTIMLSDENDHELVVVNGTTFPRTGWP